MNTTFSHLEKPEEKCLDCNGDLVFLRDTKYNTHYICERCEAVFYWRRPFAQAEEE